MTSENSHQMDEISGGKRPLCVSGLSQTPFSVRKCDFGSLNQPRVSVHSLEKTIYRMNPRLTQGLVLVSGCLCFHQVFKIPVRASARSEICTVRPASLPEAGTLIIPEARRVRRSEPSLLNNEGRAGGQRGLQTD